MAILEFGEPKITSDVTVLIRWDIWGMGKTIGLGGICTELPTGTADEPGEIISSRITSKDGETTNAGKDATFRKSAWPGGVLRCYGFGKSKEGIYYPAGGQECSVIRWDWPDPAPPKPDLWTWSASNGTATAVQTKEAHTAVAYNGATTDFSHNVWNDLVAKINEVTVAVGKSWDDSYGAYAATLMSTSDMELTAKRFNAARYNVGRSFSTGIAEVSKGDAVLGRYFTILTNKLNEWIMAL